MAIIKDTKPKGDEKKPTDEVVASKTLKLLQEQIEHEFYAERLYYAISAWCDWKGYVQTAKFFSMHAAEEHKHAMSFVNFIQKRGEHALFPKTNTPTTDFDDMKAVINAALEHEYFISSKIKDIYMSACEESDFMAKNQARIFIEEQIEEEQLFKSLAKWLEINEGKANADFELEVVAIHNRESHIIGNL